MKNNVSIIKDCYGCGVCTKVCGKNLIHMTLDAKGFYKPVINHPEDCIECKLCLDVCACNHQNLSFNGNPLATMATWSNDSYTRESCSSGGVGYEIAKSLLERGYKVAAVRYNIEKQRAEHYIAHNEEELQASKGSKYLQSFTEDCWREINRKDKFLVVGTPCQIDSMRRYAQKMKCEENFIFMDFFCHGVPSYLMWKDYLNLQQPKLGKISNVAWRNKKFGWHDSWCITLSDAEDKTILSRLSGGDLFYRMFLGDFCSNEACRKQCKYKYLSSAADIRIGDCWGRKFQSNHEGVSCLVAFTDRGKKIIDSLDKQITKEYYPMDVVAEYQMRKNAGRAYLANIAWKMLFSSKSYKESTWKKLILIEAVLHLPERVFNKLCKIIKGKN